MLKNLRFLIPILILALIFPLSALAHPGRTNVSGCHTCKTNCESWGLKKGEYHCHGEMVKQARVQAKTNAKVINKK